jgi:hypothetical protein
MEINKENYRAFSAINYSLLSTLSLDPSLVKQDKKETDAMSFGSLFDCLLTDKDRFDKEYIVSSVTKPSGQLGEFLDIYLNYEHTDIKEKYDFAYVEMKARNPKLRDGIDKFIGRMESEALPYLNFLRDSKGKKVISSDDFYLATQMKDSLMTNEFTGKYFNMDYTWEIQYQVPLVANLLGYEFKGLLDMMVINHSTKEIYPIDIKTTSDYPNKFQGSVITYNYLIQATLYWDLVQANYPDYKIHDFMFFVSSLKLPNKPYIWWADKDSRIAGRTGYTYNGKYHKGYQPLAEELKWHEETGLWQYSKTTYQNNGLNKIDFFL